MTLQELKIKIDNDGKKYGRIMITNGVFGEIEDSHPCAGIIELPILHPPEGGTFVKYYGCSYLFKGEVNEQKVRGMEQAKSNISTLPYVMRKSVLYSLAIVLRFVFQRKKCINDLHIFFEEIRWKTMRHVSPPTKHLNQFALEIRRAMNVAVKKEFRIEEEFDLFNNTHPMTDIKFTVFDLAGFITKITAFVTLIMQMDCAYRFPLQDILGEKDTENAKKSGYGEVMRLCDIMIERQTNLIPVEGVSERTGGVPYKFKFLKRMLQCVLITSPTIRRILQNFLVELDEKKVALDEDDWYFCLQRDTHNYRGWSLADRLKEKEWIDKEKGHIILEFTKK